MLISHPDRSLAEHLTACDRISQKILALHYVAPLFYDKAQLETWRRLLVYFHDLGKGTDFFQAKIVWVLLNELDKADVRAFYEKNKAVIEAFKKEKLKTILQELRDDPALGHHAALGSYFLQAHLPEETPLIERLILLEVIKRHHGNLKNFEVAGAIQFEACLNQADYFNALRERLNTDAYQAIFPIAKENWEQMLPFFKRRKLARYWRNFKKETPPEKLRYFFLQHYLFSLLLSADKGDMQLEPHKEEGKAPHIQNVHRFASDLIVNYKQQVFGTKPPKGLNALREEAFKRIAQNIKRHKDAHFFSITLPTGLGKTLAAYHTAIHLQQATIQAEKGRPRIVYCLPFTSVIDQNAEVWKEILKVHPAYKNNPTDFFAVNHYLAPIVHKEAPSDEISVKKAEYLVEGWEQDFIITTFVKLLDGIFTNKNRLLRKFHNMTNAIILLDEVQSIPPKYYEAIELVFRKMAAYFGTKFVFITATQPLLFAPEGKEDIIELTENIEGSNKESRYFFDVLNRIEINQSLLRKYNYLPIPEERGNLLELFAADIEAQPERSFLIICNTVKHSQEVFASLQRQFGDTRQCRYLSASLLPIIRREKIHQIKKDSANQVPQIVVSTQVVEAGVDIDLDIVYRDFAPLDSINQSAGRCNRNARNGFKGIVKLFHSGKAKYIYDQTALLATQDTLSDYEDKIPEPQLFGLNQSYFQKIHQAISMDSDASKELIRCMENLQVETLNDRFQLIDSLSFLYYNVFIPYCPQAIAVWEKYQSCFEEQDTFKRKRKIKQIRPELLQYVTRFPKDKYRPPEEQAENHLLYCADWQSYYDLTTGFIQDRLEEHTLIL